MSNTVYVNLEIAFITPPYLMFLLMYFNDLLIEKLKIERNKKSTKTFALNIKKKTYLFLVISLNIKRS